MNDNTQEAPKPLRRVRIQNDGGPGYNTKITDADTGKSIYRVFHCRLVDINVQEMPKAILWMYTPVVDVTVDADVVTQCPYCGAQKPDPEELSKDFRLKLAIGDVDLDLSIDKLKRLQALQRAALGD